MYCLARYFVLTRGTYDLMLKDLSGEVKVSTVARGAPLNLHAWRCMKSLLLHRNVSVIYLKGSPHLHRELEEGSIGFTLWRISLPIDEYCKRVKET